MLELLLTKGDDRFMGTSADEHIIGDRGNDTIFGNGGSDKLEGWGGDDVLISFGSGGVLSGNQGNDFLEAKKTAYGQYHIYGSSGDDTFVMHLDNRLGWGHQGFHVYGGDGSDSFRFLESPEAALLSRIDDFDTSRDSIWIDGLSVDLNAPPSSVQFVEFMGQQWIKYGSSALIGLEGARLQPDGDVPVMGDGVETHFHILPENLDDLIAVDFIDQVNFVPYQLYQAFLPELNVVDDYAGVATGTAGADYVFGEGGSSTFIMGAGGDVVQAGKGHDIVHGEEGDDLIAGGGDRDWLDGGWGDDQLWGGSENDTLFGGDGQDTLYGGTGNDHLTGAKGDDTVVGGAGHDTAYFQAIRANYMIDITNDGVRVQDRVSNRDGSDKLTEVERLSFLDGDWELQKFSNVTSLTEAEFSTFVEMYIAYFNRAPDSEGLLFWANALSNGTSLEQIATLFFDQDETRNAYPNPADTEAFVTSVYQNVLGRDLDQLGFDFWVGALDSGSVSRPEFMLEIIRGAKAAAGEGSTDAFKFQKSEDIQYLSDKADLGAYFSAILGMSDVEDAKSVMQIFDGTADSIGQAKSAIDSYYFDALNAANGDFLVRVVGIIDDPFAIA